MPKRNWQDADREILAALDLLAEFEAMGVKITGVPDSRGFVACRSRARGEDDRKPSASINIQTGRYVDRGATAESLSFFDFAAKYGGYGDWRAARKHFAEQQGIELPETKQKLRPIDLLEIKQWKPSKIVEFLKARKPITPESILANGGQLAQHGRNSIVAIPVFPAGDGIDSPAQAWACYNSYGGKLPTKSAGDVKVKNYGPVNGGLMGFWALERLSRRLGEGEGAAVAPAAVVWKVEGPSDMLALWTVIPPELRETHLVVCNGGGATERPTAAVVHAFAAAPMVHVLHDADTAGESGAKKWAEAIASVTRVRQVRLPYEVKESHGKDLRDWLNEGHGYAELLEIARATTPTEATAAAADAVSIEPLANYTTVPSGESEKIVAIPTRAVQVEMMERTNGWPRKVGSKLFYHKGEELCWLTSPEDLFSRLQDELGVINWKEVTGCVSKREFFRSVLRNAQEYESVEFMPHEPLLPNVYYACEFPEPGDGAAMSELLEMFCVGDSVVDKQLILAMFATTLWGGLPGSRPMFMITSDDGRGVGKSKMTDILAAFCGGAVELSANGDIDTLRTRLLSPKAAKKRLARLDNVKSFRFSCADIESLITTSTISGKELWVGEGDRQNNFTWLITLNGASLSEDMAQRVVTIKIKRPPKQRDWEKRILRFIAANRQALIADLIDFLRSPAKEIPLRSRWAAWEGEIVARLDNWEAVQDAIADRSGEANVEANEIQELEDSIRENLEKYQFHPDHERIFISSDTMRRWFCDVMGEKKSKITVGRIVGQFITEGKTHNLKLHRLNRGRGYLWEGEAVNEYTPVKTELDQKIEGGGF